MKYDTTPQFDRQFKRLPAEHRRMFQDVVHDLLLPALAAGAHLEKVPWPPKLRIHKIRTKGLLSMTWSFAAPDGRALFMVGTLPGTGEDLLTWRAIGYHEIYG